MAEYEIKFNREDGWSYGNGNIPVESAFVELSDEEVQTLVDLMKQQNTYDASALWIEKTHPDIFEKLKEACDSIAFDIALAEALREAHYYDEEDLFLEKLQDYCIENFGYTKKSGDFRRWLYLRASSMSCNQLRHMYDDAGIEIWDDVLNFEGIEQYEYKVTIPQQIVAMVFDL
jgi:hypothetical protein